MKCEYSAQLRRKSEHNGITQNSLELFLMVDIHVRSRKVTGVFLGATVARRSVAITMTFWAKSGGCHDAAMIRSELVKIVRNVDG